MGRRANGEPNTRNRTVPGQTDTVDITAISQFAPEGTEAGVGLALEDAGRYLFFLAGTRHRCPPGELFYAGIGGHREVGEDWLTCARRESREELGVDVDLLPAVATWYLPHSRPARPVSLTDTPRPLALYEMIHPPGTPRAGDLYRIVIYRARLLGEPHRLPPEEVSALIAFTRTQVIQGPHRRPTLSQLLAEGAHLIAGGHDLDRATRLFPLGTADALARVLRHSS